MLPLLAILCVLAAAAAAAFALRSRRRAASARPPGAAAPASAQAPSEGEAWVTRITQSIPTVVRRLAESEAPKPPGRAGAGLQGNLAQTPLHDLLQFLALGRKCGVLELASGRRTGRVVLADGRVAKAAYRGKEGMEAAFLMLDLAEGDFEFYESQEAASGSGGPGSPIEVVDVIMLWMARKPKKKQASTG